MKIVSKFYDYYDNMSYMFDKRLTYMRHLKSNNDYELSVKIQKYINTNSRYVSNNYYESTGVVIIGNKIIPFIMGEETITKQTYLGTKYTYVPNMYYDLKSVIKARIPHGYSCYWESQTNAISKEHFDKNYTDLYNTIRTKTDAPIVSWSLYSNPDKLVPGPIHMGKGLMINPILRELQFDKVMTSVQVLQNIEMYMNKVFHPEKPTKQPNKSKITSHGFDLKQSFRHRKV